MTQRLRDNRGFTLLNAIFILVVLAVLGAYMVSMFGVESRTPVLVLRGAQAYHAARSGLEWGFAQAAAGSCSTTSFSVPGTGFSVDVSCSAEPVTEASGTYNVYRISAFAHSGSYGSDNYVSRRVEGKVTGP